MIETLRTINKNESVNKLLDNFDRGVTIVPGLLAMRALRVRPIFGLNNRTIASPEVIRDILFNSKISKSAPEELCGVTHSMTEKIRNFIQKNQPIEFCLIAFSPKSHSPIETGMRRLPDLGEMMFIKRLLDIDATIKQVFKPGVKFNICFEGFSFVDRFGNSVEEVGEFKRNLQEKIKQLDCDNKITLGDLVQVTSIFPNFEDIRLQKELDIRNNFDSNSETRQEIETFLPVMRRASVDLSGCDFKDLLAITIAQKDVSVILTKEQDKLRTIIKHKALENAIFYTSFNKARQHLRIMEETFPDQIYISITSKPGRLAIHPISVGTKLFPHHGVPLLFLDGRFEIIGFRDLIDRQEDFGRPRFKRVYLDEDGDDQPFFFQEIQKQKTTGLRFGCYG